MEKIAKRAGCLVVLALAAALLFLPDIGSAKVYSGRWEKNTKWSYDTATRTVTIECRGRMADYDGDSVQPADWQEWYTKAKRIVFKKGITYIGASTFDNFRKVEEVVLPEGLVSIGNSAFWDASNLKTIRFPSTLKKIAENAFDNSGLESVSLRNVEKVGSGAFSGTNLKKLTVPSTCKDIKSYAFNSCFELRQVKLENGMKTIRTSTFSRTGLESVTIPASVTSIGTRAFFAFSPEESKLKSVTINSTQITKWGKRIFGKARKDLVIRVPKSKKREYTKALREGGLPDYVKIVGK